MGGILLTSDPKVLNIKGLKNSFIVAQTCHQNHFTPGRTNGQTKTIMGTKALRYKLFFRYGLIKMITEIDD